MAQLPSKTHNRPARHRDPPSPNKPVAPATISANELLVAPTKPVSGGDAVPIGIRITPDWLKKAIKTAFPSSPLVSSNNPIVLSAASITLNWNGTPIATFALGKLALAVTGANKAIQVSTRLRTKTEPNKTTTGKLSATAALTPSGEKELPPVIAEATLQVQYSDCAAAKIGQLFVSLQPVQPKSSDIVAVKSYVPAPALTARKLNSIECAFNPPVTGTGGANVPSGSLPGVLRVDLGTNALQYLAEEIFFGFDFQPDGPGLLVMSWLYNDQRPLTASAYVDLVGA